MNTNRKILIVDDQINYINTITKIFGQFNSGYEIFRTTKPKLVFKIVEEEKPDLIITDWEMPEMSGIEMIKELKEHDSTRNTPIIMCSGVMTSPQNLDTALEAGANDYIRKPIDPIELIARTKSILKLSEYQNQLLEQKNRELTENSMYMVQNNELINLLVNDINKIIDSASEKIRVLELARQILNNIDTKMKEDSWRRFETYFQRVHSGFKLNLSRKFPKLSNSELRLSAFLRLGMNTKDIAAATFQSIESIKTSRYRLRKKLDLSKDDNLTTFLARL